MPDAAPAPKPNLTDLQILVSLAGGELHGYGIMRDVEERTGGAVRLGPGTLYGAIKRLLDAKWVEALPACGDAGADPRRRANYRLTRAGRRAASEAARQMAQLVNVATVRGLV
jgi:DNA-binding PadR family transcriptional regulator